MKLTTSNVPTMDKEWQSGPVIESDSFEHIGSAVFCHKLP